MSKATAGPWFVYRDSAENFYVGSDIVDVARIVGSDADARLIAAAPELLEALESVLDSLGALTKRHELLDWMSEEEADSVFAAIAKARGDA